MQHFESNPNGIYSDKTDIAMAMNQRGIRMTCKQENIGSTITVARYVDTSTLSCGTNDHLLDNVHVIGQERIDVTKKMGGYLRVYKIGATKM